MEPNEVCYKKEKCKNNDCFCLELIVTIVAIALAFFVGVLVAAVTGIVATLTIGGIIALIVVIVMNFK